MIMKTASHWIHEPTLNLISKITGKNLYSDSLGILKARHKVRAKELERISRHDRDNRVISIRHYSEVKELIKEQSLLVQAIGQINTWQAQKHEEPQEILIAEIKLYLDLRLTDIETFFGL